MTLELKFTDEERSIIESKIISSKDIFFAIHFTDIVFLPSILSNGINYSKATYDMMKDVVSIKGDQYGFALDGYRGNYNYVEGKYIDINGETWAIKLIDSFFTSKRTFSYLLKDNRLVTSSELETITHYHKLYLDNNQNFDFMSEQDTEKLFELVCRIKARDAFTSLYRDEKDFKSSMNVALLFDGNDIANKRDVFGLSNIYKGSCKIWVNKNSKIQGIMVYPVNILETSQIVMNAAKTIDDIIPIYNYQTELCWPNLLNPSEIK